MVPCAPAALTPHNAPWKRYTSAPDTLSQSTSTIPFSRLLLWWRSLLYSFDGFRFTPFSPRQLCDEPREYRQVTSCEEGAPTRNDNERLGFDCISPGGGQGTEAAPTLTKVDAVLAPRLLKVEQLELPSEERMVRVSYAEMRCSVRIACNRLPLANPMLSDKCSTCATTSFVQSNG